MRASTASRPRCSSSTTAATGSCANTGQLDAYGETTAVDLAQPDFVRLAGAFGVPVRETSPDALAADLEWALASAGPAVLVLRERLRWVQATP